MNKHHHTHTMPLTHSNQHRSMIVAPLPLTDRTTLRSLNNRNLDEHQFLCVLNDRSVRSNRLDMKYGNHIKTRLIQDTIAVVLKRDRRILDFGFSISDRLYGTGVYVNKVRSNGPAELEGTLKPCMRIYQVNILIETLSLAINNCVRSIQVNHIDVTRMECSQVVPLLSSSPDDLKLIVGRRAAPMFDETDELFHLDQEQGDDDDNEDDEDDEEDEDNNDNEHRSATVWRSSADGTNEAKSHSQVTISTL
jgi:hypothetical protein